MFRHITEQYENGRVTIMSDREMADLVVEYIPELADKAQAAVS